MSNITGKFSNYEMAALANEGAVLSGNQLVTVSKESDKKTQDVKSSEFVSDLLSSDDTRESKKGILSGIVSKFVNAGFELGRTASLKNGEEGNPLFELEDDAGTEQTQDNVSLSSYGRKGRFSNKPIVLNINYPKTDSAKVQQLVQEYASSYGMFLLSDDPKIAKKIKNMEESLIKEGISREQVHSMQKDIRSAVRADLSLRIKENMVYREFGESKLEDVMGKISLGEKIEEIFENYRLGGKSFGGFKKHLQGAVAESRSDAAKEISDFALQELNDQLIGKIIHSDKNVSSLDKLIKLASLNGLNIEDWIKEIFVKEKEDLGLVKKNLPDPETGKMVSAYSGDSGKNRQDQEREQKKDDLINELRAAYMQRKIRGDLFSFIRTTFKMVQAKNGLMKLGITPGDLDSIEGKVSLEADILAKVKLIDMLKEAMMERATLAKLKGPAYESNNKKISMMLKSAENLGMAFEESELQNMQKKANSDILELVVEHMNAAKERGIVKNPRGAKMFARLDSIKQRLLAEAEMSGQLDSSGMAKNNHMV